MESAIEFTGQTLAVWFLVTAVRAWFPAPVAAWLEGPQRVWPLVFVAAIGALLLSADVEDVRELLNQAVNLSIAALGADNIRQTIGPSALAPRSSK